PKNDFYLTFQKIVCPCSFNCCLLGNDIYYKRSLGKLLSLVPLQKFPAMGNGRFLGILASQHFRQLPHPFPSLPGSDVGTCSDLPKNDSFLTFQKIVCHCSFNC